MEKILSYACFKNSADFEKWQQDNPECQPTQISPYMDGVKFDFAEQPDHKQTGTATTNVKTFVVYWKAV